MRRHVGRDGEAVSAACFAVAVLCWLVGDYTISYWLSAVGALSLVAMICMEGR